MTAEELGVYPYIQCHVALPLGDALGPNYFRFMFFREPVSRILSYYNFWRSAYQADPSQWMVDDGPTRAGNQTFSEFIRDSRNEIEIVNAQTRYLCGNSTVISRDDFPTNEIRDRLHSLDVVGLTEHFSESVNRINSSIEMNIFSPKDHSNITNTKAEGMVFKDSISEADMSLLIDMLRQDFLTYEIASELFNNG